MRGKIFYNAPNRKVLGLNMPFTQSPDTVIDVSHVTYPELYGSCTVATTGLRLGEFPDTDLKGSHLSGDSWVAVQDKLHKDR